MLRDIVRTDVIVTFIEVKDMSSLDRMKSDTFSCFLE